MQAYFKTKLLFLTCFLFLIVLGCSSSDDVNQKEYLNSHTSLVYIVADNNLDPFAQQDLEEMITGYQQVESPHVNNLLVYLDDRDAPRLYRIENINGQIVKNVVRTFDERNSIDVGVMNTTLREVYDAYPANSYGLTLWSHADGWLPAQSSPVRTRSFGQDINTGDGYQAAYMDIGDLKAAFTNIPHLDYLMFDACNMQSLEVAYELKDVTDYIIGSPVEVPANGAPYMDVVPAFFAGEDKVQHIAQAFFNEYALNYSSDYFTKSKSDLLPPLKRNSKSLYRTGISISVIDCEYIEPLAEVFRETLLSGDFALTAADYYSYDSNYSHFYFDAKDIMLSQPAFRDKVEEAFQKAMPVYLYTPGTYSSFENEGRGGELDMSGSNGISCFIPERNSFLSGLRWQNSQNLFYLDSQYDFYSNFYSDLSWYTAVGWDQYLNIHNTVAVAQ